MCDICIALDRELRDLEMDIEAVIDQLGTQDRLGRERIADLTNEILAARAIYARHRAKCEGCRPPLWTEQPDSTLSAYLARASKHIA